MNIGFNYVFVSVCKANLLAQLLYVVMVKRYSSKVGWYAAIEKVQKWYAESKRLGTPALQKQWSKPLSQVILFI